MRDPRGDEVALKVLHTADWHLGKSFVGFDEADRLTLTRARLDVIDAILNVAENNQVHAVLCAGDLFDGPQPEPHWWKGLADKLAKRRWKDRPVVLLPGNHDPLTESSVYHPSHPFRRALPDWVRVVDRDDFELTLGEDAVLVARPCRRTSGQDDNALALPARADGDERIRIGMVHGSTFEMPNYQSNFPIAKDAAVRRGLDYLAIGDTHAWKVYPPDAAPTVYPSTPEQTSFGETDTGNVALVFFLRHGRSAKIRKERVARWTWRVETVHDVEALRTLRDDPSLRQSVMRLKLKLRVTPEEYEEAERILEELEGTPAQHGRVGVLQIEREGLELDTRDIEQTFEKLPPVLRAAARRLKEEEATQPEVAQRALYHLYRLSRRAEGGAA
ncbi:MAG: DNA repair exonuclease [Kofleriaceae bacterium]|nr:DNA repair exonuclease [Kofleriaceae bacterium]